MYGIRPTRMLCRLRAWRRVEPAQLLIERIALDRHLSRLANEAHQLVERDALRRVCAGFMVDLLPHHGALEVVHAKRQSDLRQGRRHHDPMRFHVGDVIEEEAAYGDRKSTRLNS